MVHGQVQRDVLPVRDNIDPAVQACSKTVV